MIRYYCDKCGKEIVSTPNSKTVIIDTNKHLFHLPCWGEIKALIGKGESIAPSDSCYRNWRDIIKDSGTFTEKYKPCMGEVLV